MERKPEYSVVIPVYNSEKTLVELHSRLAGVMSGMEGGYEIILVDDGSRDGSWAVMANLSSEDDGVKAIRLAGNFSQHNALLCGFRHARGEYVITLDDDLQNPPEEIPKLVERLMEGYDAVYGVWEKSYQPLHRRLISIIGRRILSLVTGIDATGLTTFRAIRRPVVDAVLAFESRYVNLGAYISLSSKKTASVKVKHQPRREGGSNYTLGKLLEFAFTFIMAALALRFGIFSGASGQPYSISEIEGFD